MMCGVAVKAMPASTSPTSGDANVSSNTKNNNNLNSVNSANPLDNVNSVNKDSNSMNSNSESQVNLERLSPASQPSNDDLGSSDEVKVFRDEDERDCEPSESYQAELQAEKSSLIHESEQVKSPLHGGIAQPFAVKNVNTCFFDV